MTSIIQTINSQRRAILGIILLALLLGLWLARERIFGPRINPQTAFYTQVESTHVPLADFSSYATPQAVLAQLQKAGYKTRVVRDDYPDSPRYPPHRMVTITVEDYRQLGSTGVLTLDFFNQRLYEAEFDPADNLDHYVAALHQSLPKLRRDRVGEAVLVDGNLRISSSVDLARSLVGRTLDSKAYVIWQDLRLTQQRDLWDKTYGSIPIPPH
ncbi:MAG TPA: hypothetical protein VN046_01635 [Stenotrophobium sp.]|jgi:hypothetical protein|nr:hypothetical protein [Stenotrophobium sp.]